MKKYQLLSAFEHLTAISDTVDITYYRLSKFSRLGALRDLARLFVEISRHDAFLCSNSGTVVMTACFLSKMLVSSRPVVAFWDTNLTIPQTPLARLLPFFKRILLGKVDLMLCLHKDYSGYVKYYRIDEAKFCYVAFKPNNRRLLAEFTPTDGGFVLAAGASHRDYDTFFRAMRKLNYPGKILLPNDRLARYHGTPIDTRGCPDNVEIIRHSFDPMSWNEYLSQARIIAIPIKANVLQPAGISVYLEAMAFGKPVIVTEGASTRGLLTRELAEIVSPNDPSALAASIQRLWVDADYRVRLGERGRQYALSLGDTDRISNDIIRHIREAIEYRASIRQR